jgi:hypothetical protein
MLIYNVPIDNAKIVFDLSNESGTMQVYELLQPIDSMTYLLVIKTTKQQIELLLDRGAAVYFGALSYLLNDKQIVPQGNIDTILWFGEV